MNKEEILLKSRKENNDEGLKVAENKGREIGMAAFCIVFIFVVLFNFFNGIDSTASMAMFWEFLAAEAYPKYRFTKNKTYLVTTIAGGIASILNLVNYVISVLG